MKIHHLNCGTLRPPGATMICHVLLLEYADRLVLIDSGFGLQDIADPKGRIGPVRHVIRPKLDPAETAIRQIERLGLAARDVSDILMTHLDVDHAGGLADFPAARVHVTVEEAEGALRHPSRREKQRYNNRQLAFVNPLTEHPRGLETWRGFDGVTLLDDVASGVMLVPLPGHTRGHAGYAIESDGEWLLHAGDAFYLRASISRQTPVPLLARIFEKLVAFDAARVAQVQEQLAELYHQADPALTILCTHDLNLFPSPTEARPFVVRA